MNYQEVTALTALITVSAKALALIIDKIIDIVRQSKSRRRKRTSKGSRNIKEKKGISRE